MTRPSPHPPKNQAENGSGLSRQALVSAQPFCLQQAGRMGLTPPRSSVPDALFRDAMSSLAATLWVVTAGRGSERLGRTVTATLSLSVAPPTVLIALDAECALAASVRRRQTFSLAALAEDQAAIADAFAGRLPPEKRFDADDWGVWPSGNPRLPGAAVGLDCEVLGSIVAGTHLLLIGGVAEAEIGDGRAPLIWHGRRYASVRPPSQPLDLNHT